MGLSTYIYRTSFMGGLAGLWNWHTLSHLKVDLALTHSLYKNLQTREAYQH